MRGNWKSSNRWDQGIKGKNTKDASKSIDNVKGGFMMAHAWDLRSSSDRYSDRDHF